MSCWCQHSGLDLLGRRPRARHADFNPVGFDGTEASTFPGFRAADRGAVANNSIAPVSVVAFGRQAAPRSLTLGCEVRFGLTFDSRGERLTAASTSPTDLDDPNEADGPSEVAPRCWTARACPARWTRAVGRAESCRAIRQRPLIARSCRGCRVAPRSRRADLRHPSAPTSVVARRTDAPRDASATAHPTRDP